MPIGPSSSFFAAMVDISQLISSYLIVHQENQLFFMKNVVFRTILLFIINSKFDNIYRNESCKHESSTYFYVYV